jgi:large subunit ribosomal protein L9
MEVILKQDIENLGLIYDIVSVKPGYARNYLIPNQLVDLATKQAKEKRQAVLEKLSVDEAIHKSVALEKLEAIKSISIKIQAKVGSGGDKLFGSISNADLSEHFEKNGVSIDKKYIKIPGNTIKNIGNFVAKIRLHREVEFDFSFDVIADTKE